MDWNRPQRRAEPGPVQWEVLCPLVLLGAYLNVVAFGFIYGMANHDFELALVNWLRDPSLYPKDAVTEAFARFPAAFWQVVAYLSSWVGTEKVLFVFFIITKVLFFGALARLVARALPDYRLVGCIVVSVALSPFLAMHTPFGASDVLNAVQTNTSLAIALLLWAGAFLLEGRWLRAMVLCGVTVYVNALFLIYFAFALAAFALLDWQQQKREILLASLIGVGFGLPWLFLSSNTLAPAFPQDFVEVLRMFYPFHISLLSHSAYDLVRGAGLLAATICMILVAANAGLRRHRRLELLAASFLLPVLVGVVIGEILPLPQLVRLQFLRADSFLFLYALLLLQVYAGNLLLSEAAKRPATSCLIGVLAILLPLSHGLTILLPLTLGFILWGDRKQPFEHFCRYLSRADGTRRFVLFLLVSGAALASFGGDPWNPTAVAGLIGVSGCLLVYHGASAMSNPRLIWLAAGICGLVFVVDAVALVPQPARLWNPVVELKPAEADWRGVQRWAKANTPRDARFLVPTFPCGFRAFSERSAWGEWKDGTGVYLFPPFAESFRERMNAFGLGSTPEWTDFQAMQEAYRRQPWEHLLQLAREHNLNYIIQFADVPTAVSAVFANHTFAVYKVER